MIANCTRRHSHPFGARLFSTMGVAALVAALSLVSSCTSKKQEATEALDQAIKKCRAADGPIHEAPLMRGDETTPVLTRACNKEKSDVEMVDEFTAQVEVGPYTWEAGRNQSIGVWMIKDVSWPPLDAARNHLERDPDENQLNRAIEKLREAQNQFPESGWVRLKLLDTLIQRKTKKRSTDESGLELGDAVEEQFDKTVEWAADNERRAVEAKARLKLIDYFEGFVQQVEDDRAALGSRDDWYKERIELNEDEGNEERAKKLREEFEERKEKRPEKRRRYDELIQEAQSNLCARLAHLKPDGIADDELKDRVESAKGGTNCRKLLQQDPAKGGGADSGGTNSE